MAKTYGEKLKDPRWQKKRLAVLQRDNWACLICGSKENTLHVHHGYYERGFDPWDYPADSLHTLCEGCHADVEVTMSEIRHSIGILHPKKLVDLGGMLGTIEDVSHGAVTFNAGLKEALEESLEVCLGLRDPTWLSGEMDF